MSKYKIGSKVSIECEVLEYDADDSTYRVQLPYNSGKVSTWVTESNLDTIAHSSTEPEMEWVDATESDIGVEQEILRGDSDSAMCKPGKGILLGKIGKWYIVHQLVDDEPSCWSICQVRKPVKQGAKQ